MLKLNLFFLSFISVLLLYKSILINFGLDNVVYGLILLFIIISSFIFAARLKVPKGAFWLLPFIFWGILSSILSIFNNSFFTGAVGFLAAYLFLFFWILCLSSLDKENKNLLFRKFIRIQIALAAIMAIFALYQFFYDPALFGIKPHALYSDAEVFDTNVTRRATSFIGSSQNLGLYLGLMCGFLALVGLRKSLKIPLLLLFLAGGILSGTRAFFLFVIVFFFFFYLQDRKKTRAILSMILIGAVLLSLIIIFQKLDIEVAYRIYLLKDSGPVIHFDFWKPFLTHDSLYHYVFGQGIGKTERLISVLTGQEVPSTESYLLKVYHEMGISGLLAFFLIYFVSIYRALKMKNRTRRVISAILLSLIINLATTPSFAGLTMSFIIWPIILIPFFVPLPAKLKLSTIEKKYDLGFTPGLQGR